MTSPTHRPPDTSAAGSTGASEGDRAPRTARERGRAELTAHILGVAREHLAEQGAAALSLRAIAREIGMASSAIYRYFPSRDDLFTALIVGSYESIGAVAEAAEASTAGAPLTERWLALAGAIRAWATQHPHQYALIYGSPVPGYAAPEVTIGAAAVGPTAWLRICADGVTDGSIAASEAAELPSEVRSDFAALRDSTGLDVPDAVLARAFQAWFTLFGFVSWELFGHLHGVVTEGPPADELFAVQMTAAGALVAGPSS